MTANTPASARWRRGLRRALLYLILGGATSVAVAWACALWSPLSTTWRIQHTDGGRSVIGPLIPEHWPRPAWSAERSVSWQCGAEGGPGLRYYTVECFDTPGGLLEGAISPAHSTTVCRAGWPLRALECHEHGAAVAAAKAAVPPRWVGGAAAPTSLGANLGNSYLTFSLTRGMRGVERPIPYRPRPLAFAANAVFYASAVHFALWHLFTFRGWMRLGRGRCPNCCYPIGVSPVCTECGRAVPARAGARATTPEG